MRGFFQHRPRLPAGIGKSLLGDVTLDVKERAFCTMEVTRFLEKAPSSTMKSSLRPALKEVAVDGTGVKAKF